MTCAHFCRHQRCPTPHSCAYPLHQAEGGQVANTELPCPTAPFVDLGDLGTHTDMPLSIAKEWLWLALIVILLGVLALIGLGRAKGWL